MHRIVRTFSGLLLGLFLTVGFSQAVLVDGYCYLEGQSNHAGTTVLFEEDSPGAVTDSTTTDDTGYYQIDLAAGAYDVYYTQENYYYAYLLDQLLVSPTTLPDVTLAAYPQGIYISGPLSGVLEAATYVVTGSISVEAGASLTILPGATLLFWDFYEYPSFSIHGTLLAEGTEQDSIKFVAAGESYWGGIDFLTTASGSSSLEYCEISGSSNSGIYCTNASPTISHCLINRNNAEDGGGVDLHNSNPTISYCTIKGNTAGNGGGIQCWEASPTIEYCIIDDNTAWSDWGGGGGIFCRDNSNPLIEHCTITQNSASDGGGIRTMGSSPVIHYCTVSENTSWYHGAGIRLGQSSEIIGCTISYNVSSQHCGGIYVSGSSTIVDCEISHNIAQWSGGGMLFSYSNASVIQCIIIDNQALEDVGGGIACPYSSSPVFEDCIISGNSSNSSGGGASLTGISPVLNRCVISDNTALYCGGGIFSDECNFELNYCTLFGNSAGSEGATIFMDESVPFISNCTISYNNTNGLRILDQSVLTLNNTIVSHNSAPGIIGDYATSTIQYSNFFDNAGGNFGGTLPQWLGQVVTVNANGDSCDLYFNLYDDPLFANPAGGNFQVTWANFPTWDETRSHCIDAGDPNSPLDPDSSIADIGAFYFDQLGTYPIISVSSDTLEFSNMPIGYSEELPLTIYNTGDTTLVIYDITASEPSFSSDFDPADSLIAPDDSLEINVTFVPQEITTYLEFLTIENNAQALVVVLKGKGVGPVDVNLYPYDPPIVIPAAGGSFDYRITVENRTPDAQLFDLWMEAILPDSSSYPVLSLTGLTIGGTVFFERDRTQQVPGTAPPGNYTYLAYAGVYPSVIEDQGWFTFEKEGSDSDQALGDLGSLTDWLCYGEEFELSMYALTVKKPSEFALHGTYPNPFNPLTTLSYSLPEASIVHLDVYDISGRLVQTLIDGYREAGIHVASFNASHLPSGVYIYRLKAGNFTASGKMVLLK